MDSPTLRTSQVNEFLNFGDRNVHVDNIVRLLDFLVDGGSFTPQQADLYWNALYEHYHHGVLPGMERFPLPGIDRELYFLPALTVLFDNYIDPPTQLESIRIEWSEEVLSDTDSLTDSELSDLVGDIIDPDSVIDECLLAVINGELGDVGGGVGQDDLSDASDGTDTLF